MSDHDRANPDDLLENSLAAMRNQTLPPGPSARTVADTLSALRRAEARPKLWQRVITMTLTQKIAAAIALTLGGLTVYFVLSLFSGFASISYAQVADQIRAMKSMTCTITAKRADLPKGVSIRAMFMNPGKTRMEVPGVNVIIVDSESHRTMTLNEMDKTATITDMTVTNAPPRQPAAEQRDFIQQFKDLADGKGEPVPDRLIGSVNAKGFHVQESGFDGIVYANPKTGIPIEVDFGKLSGADQVVMDNFNFDADLTADLFDSTPPDGYKIVNRKLTINSDLAENVVPILQAYALRKDGQFPPQLTNWADIIRTLQPGANPDPQLRKVFTNMGALTGLLSQYHQGTQWDYLPDGVKLGDSGKIVFWYQPKGSTTYKAVYGDLRIADITADQLPAHQAK